MYRPDTQIFARLFLAAAFLGSALVHAGTSDPWESFNRSIFEFNEFADRIAVKPVAVFYDDHTPRQVNDGVTHFFDNLSEITTFFNSVLQWKPRKAGNASVRFLLNSTVGLAGVFDVATKVGLESDREDFGQTLAHWGMSSGPYLVLPIFGPSTVRDAGGRLGDYLASPKTSSSIDDTTSWTFTAVDAVDTRADLLKAEEFVMGDRYLFLRDAYLSRREAAIKDGEVTDDFGEEDFEDFEDFDEATPSDDQSLE